MLSRHQMPCSGQAVQRAATRLHAIVGPAAAGLPRPNSQQAPTLLPAQANQTSQAAPCASAAPAWGSSPACGSRSGRRATVVCQASAKKDCQVQVQRVSTCKRTARVTVPVPLIKDLFKKAVDKLQKNVVGDLRGFRAGAPLPLNILVANVGGQQRFKGFCIEEVLLSAQEWVAGATAGESIIPGSETILTRGSDLLAAYDPAKELSFDMAFEVAPPLRWHKPFNELEVTIQDTGDFTTDAAAVDDLLRQYRKQHGFSRVVTGRGLQLGDTAIMDMKVYERDSKVELPGLCQTKFPFDTEADPLNLTQDLLGIKQGEERTFDVTFPDDYSVEVWQGLKARAVVKVHELFAWSLPEFDDAYVQQHHAQFKTAAEMRESLLAATAMKRVQALDKALEDAVVKAVADAVNVDELPERMVQALGERQYQAALLAMLQEGRTKPEDVEALATEEMAAEFIAKRRDDLVEQIKFNLAVDEIFSQQGLVLDDDAVKAEFELRKQQMEAVNQQVEADEMMDDVKETVKNVTVIEWLKDNVKRTVLPWNEQQAKGQPAGSGSQPAAAAAV